jgi:hypothetical protein
MADIDVQEFTSGAQNHTGDTNYDTAFTIAASNWVANAKYLVFMSARITGSVNTVDMHYKLAEATSGDIAESELIGEQLRHYGWWGVYDVPATAEDLLFQHKTADAGETVFSSAMVLVKIRLDDDLVENTDWRFAEDFTKDATPEDTYVTYANIASFTPGTPADHRLILGYLRVDGNSINRSHLWHLEENVNGAGFVEIGGEMMIEGETTTEFKTYIIAWVDDSGTAGTREYRVQMKNEDTATNTRHAYSSVFVLEANAFADHVEDKNTTPLTGTDALQILNAIADYAPAATGNQVIIRFAQGDAGAIQNWRGAGLEIDDVAEDATWIAADTSRSLDASDKIGTTRVQLKSVASSGQKLEHVGDDLSTSGAWDERSIFVFSVALSAAAPVTRYIRSSLVSRKPLKTDDDRLASTGLISAGRST